MEALLNAFARFIALIERTGNALGTLAFVWASVVVLGGFPDHLGDDFWVATAIVFLEAFRAFSRESRSDDQLLFKTTGGIKLKRVELGTSSRSLYYVNAVIMPLCVWTLPSFEIIYYHLPIPPIPGYDAFVSLLLLVILDKLGFYKFIGYISRKENHVLLQLSPAAAILLFGVARYLIEGRESFPWKFYILVPHWFIIYILARFSSQRDHCRFRRVVTVSTKVLRAIVLLSIAVNLFFRFKEPTGLVILLGPLLLGNLQTPMALVRIFLSCGWFFLSDIEVYHTTNGNVKLAVKLLYIMVFCQGILYLLACILESFSFLPRRSLALSCGLVDKLGMESIDLYYEQAYDTFLHESLFDTTKKMSLVTFAVDALNSDTSWEKKRSAVRILDSFLLRHKTASSSNTELMSLITTSTMTLKTLISMLGWTVLEDADIRLFAAKVTTQIAPYLRIVSIPGTVQMVSSLLDAHEEPMAEDISTPIVDENGGNIDNQQISNGSSSSPDIEAANATAGQASTQSERNNAKCYLVEWISIRLQHIKELRSVPREDLKDRDSLPALGMKILEGLAHDLQNCAEISRSREVLPKIIGFVSCITGPTVPNREKIEISSLTLLSRLASVKGEIGITLRHELSENPFLIGSLAEILVLEGNFSNLQRSELAMDIIIKLASDEKTRKKIGRIQVMIDKLVQEFLGGDEPRKLLRAAAGEALAMLAIESPDNCSAMLMNEPNYMIIGDLANKLQRGEHIYTAASLLQSLCKNCTQVLRNQGQSDHLSSTLTVVLGKIMDAEGKQLEALVGLASQICSVLCEHVAPVLESCQDYEALVEKLVGELNSHKKPTLDEFPNIRALLVGLTVSIMEFCPAFAPIFREHRMAEALTKVEQYMVFFGTTGVVSEEPTGALPTLVARAKLLISANATSV